MISIQEEIESEAGRCIKCGFCDAVCPTLPAKDYSSYWGARGRMILANELVKKRDREFADFLKLSRNSFDSCLSCYACLVECPSSLNAGKVSELVKKLVVSMPKKDVKPNPISTLITNPIMKYDNPLGLKKECNSWTEGMDLPSSGEFLLFTGSLYQLMPYSSKLVSITSKIGEGGSGKLASLGSKLPSVVRVSKLLYDHDTNSRMQKILKEIVLLLQISKVSYYHDEELDVYPGTYLYELGFEESFKEYAMKLAEKFKKRKVKKIITIDPHTYDLLKNVYPKYTNFKVEVVYYLDLINADFKKNELKTTFHDPCHLSRHSDYYSTPRKLIAKITENIEPKNSKTRTLCCGGPDELEFPGIAKRVAERRYNELKRTNAGIILTSCPVCLMNLREGDEVLDIAEFLVDNLVYKLPEVN